MRNPTSPNSSAIQTQGFAILPKAFSQQQVQQLNQALSFAFSLCQDNVWIQYRAGQIFAARNILQIFPQIDHWWRRPLIVQTLTDVLGKEFGLVRVLYFDKPPGQSWALPWHKDRTLAVQENHLASNYFQHPTKKAGVKHVEADQRILNEMLTLRIHLDAVTDANGPLLVIPGSHLEPLLWDQMLSENATSRMGASTSNEALEHVVPETIYANVGDVLAMRPHLTHCSGNSDPHTDKHRRILHLEFAANQQLPDGYQWNHWLSLRTQANQQPETVCGGSA